MEVLWVENSFQFAIIIFSCRLGLLHNTFKSSKIKMPLNLLFILNPCEKMP